MKTFIIVLASILFSLSGQAKNASNVLEVNIDDNSAFSLKVDGCLSTQDFKSVARASSIVSNKGKIVINCGKTQLSAEVKLAPIQNKKDFSQLLSSGVLKVSEGEINEIQVKSSEFEVFYFEVPASGGSTSWLIKHLKSKKSFVLKGPALVKWDWNSLKKVKLK